MPDTLAFPVGLEEGPDGATLVHSFTVLGCAALGATREEALEAFSRVLTEWLQALGAMGEPLPAGDAELEIVVDEWVEAETSVATGESAACFDADLPPVTQGEILLAVRRLGDLRGRLLERVRRIPDAALDRSWVGEWTARRALEELARAQWWTLTRLGASPLAELPARTVGRLDTAMALIVQQLTELPDGARGRVIELDGETWTPRKVLRRLLWLEWSLGRVAILALQANGDES